MGGNKENPKNGDNQKKEGGGDKDKQDNPMNAQGQNDKDKKDGKGKSQAERDREELDKKLAEINIGGKESKDRERKDKDFNPELRKAGRWGELPKRIRDELDVHARERFMPRYEDLLRQYYRTIAEQGTRRKEGD